MRRPPPAVRLIGHPVVTGCAALAGMPLCAFFALHGTDGLFPALILGALLDRVLKANERVTEYRAWQSAWDGMAGDSAPRRKPWRTIARATVAVAAGLYAVANLADPVIQVGVALIGLALSLWVIVALCRRVGIGLGRRGRPGKTDLVTITVRGPLMPVPTLKQAVGALPEHCQCLLQSEVR